MTTPRLVPFTDADLPSVCPWFDDPETRRWLGHHSWAEMILRLAADHRGHRVVDRGAWLVEEADDRVALIDVEIYDDRTASVALLVAPAHRGRGVARRALNTIAARLAADGVREVSGGAEVDNAASIRTMEAAGFTRRSPEPDPDGFLYFARQLHDGESA